MILACPACSARYMVPNSLFAAGTRQVRCARCKHQWQARTPNNIDVVGVAAPPIPQAAPIPASPPQPRTETVAPETQATRSGPEQESEPDPAAGQAKQAETAPGEKTIANLPAIIKKFNWRKAGSYTAAGLVLLCLILAWPILDRQQIARAFPGLRGFYEGIGISVPKTGQGLVFDKVASELRYDSGTMKLFVDGVIRNTSDETQFIPDIKASARAADQSIIQSWWVSAPAVTIEPGGEVPFHTETGATTQRTIEDVFLEFTAKDEKHDASQ